MNELEGASSGNGYVYIGKGRRQCRNERRQEIGDGRRKKGPVGVGDRIGTAARQKRGIWKCRLHVKSNRSFVSPSATSS